MEEAGSSNLPKPTPQFSYMFFQGRAEKSASSRIGQFNGTAGSIWMMCSADSREIS